MQSLCESVEAVGSEVTRARIAQVISVVPPQIGFAISVS
jgi:transcriptional regulator CtsR